METFCAYVDESGDEGFQFSCGVPGQGSSHWFVLSAVVLRTPSDPILRQAIAKVREALGRPVGCSLHFRKLQHMHRLVYVKEIAKVNVRIVTVLIHKPCIKEPETFREKNRLYSYGVKLLLQRISWLCRASHVAQKGMPGDGSVKITFSNRSSTNYPELRTYIAGLIENGNPLDVRIEKSVIKPEQIYAKEHAQLDGLQAADAVASSFYFAVQDHMENTEPRYIKELSGRIYTHEKTKFGYGIKFWPRDCYKLLSEKPNLNWAAEMLAKK